MQTQLSTCFTLFFLLGLGASANADSSGIVTGPLILQKDIGMVCAAYGRTQGVREETDALQRQGIPFEVVDTRNPEIPEEICVFKLCRGAASKKGNVSPYFGWQEAFGAGDSCMLKL